VRNIKNDEAELTKFKEESKFTLRMGTPIIFIGGLRPYDGFNQVRMAAVGGRLSNELNKIGIKHSFSDKKDSFQKSWVPLKNRDIIKLQLIISMTLYHPATGKFFGRTCTPTPIILDSSAAKNGGLITIPENKRTIDALLLAELDSLNEADYLMVVDMTLVDCQAEPGVSPYSHLGYFTAELPCLKKSNFANNEGTVT